MMPYQFNPVEEGSRVDFLRSLVDDVQSYDVFILHDIDSKQTRERIPLYNEIGSLCERLGHKAFIPYRFVGFPDDPKEMRPRDTYVLINDIMLPQVSLVIADIGVNSISAGMIDGHAKSLGKDQIYFYERGTRLETVKEVSEMFIGLPEEARQEVFNQPRILFHRDHALGSLYKYPKIKALIEFDSQQELLRRMEETLRSYFNIN